MTTLARLLAAVPLAVLDAETGTLAVRTTELTARVHLRIAEATRTAGTPLTRAMTGDAGLRLLVVQGGRLARLEGEGTRARPARDEATAVTGTNPRGRTVSHLPGLDLAVTSTRLLATMLTVSDTSCLAIDVNDLKILDALL